MNVVMILLIFICSILAAIRFFFSFVKFGFKAFQGPRHRIYPKFLTNSEFGVHKIAKLKGIDIHYVENGDEDKPLMLMIHGFPEFWYSWKYQMLKFKENYRVVAIDMRGYGESGKPDGIANYRIDFLVNDIKMLIEHLGKEHCILVAHDWGGLVAWKFAMRYPNIVQKLIIFNSPHPAAFRRILYKSLKQLLKSWYMFFFQTPYLPEWFVSRNDFRFLDDVFNGSVMGMKNRKLNDDDIEAYKAAMSQPKAITSAINFYRASFQFPQPLQEKEKLSVPTLLIWGIEDKAIGVDLAKASALFCEDLQIRYLEGISHWSQQDDPDLANTCMVQFLSSSNTRK